MSAEKLIPYLRDLVFLAAGTYVFVTEARSDARWAVMILGMVFAAGPVAIQAYWGSFGRSQAPGISESSPPASSSPSPSPSPSPSGGEQL